MKRSDPWATILAEPGPADGSRLDTWLARRLSGVSRRAAARAIAAGRVLVDGRPARKAGPVIAGQVIEVLDPPAPGRWPALPDSDGVLLVLHVDDALLVVDKPPGIPSTPRSPDEAGTLAGRVAARFPECAGLGRSSGDAGLLQRLDRGTSGAVLVARRPESYAGLLRLQRRGEVLKRYLALIRAPAAPLPAEIVAPLGPAGPRGGRSRERSGGRQAGTALGPVERRGPWLLVRAGIRKGARHQIRAHLAGAGAPIAGDGDYGGPALPGLERPFLHAAAITFPHPRTGRVIEVSSPLPADLVSVLGALGFAGLPDGVDR